MPRNWTPIVTMGLITVGATTVIGLGVARAVVNFRQENSVVPRSGPLPLPNFKKSRPEDYIKERTP